MADVTNYQSQTHQIQI